MVASAGGAGPYPLALETGDVARFTAFVLLTWLPENHSGVKMFFRMAFGDLACLQNAVQLCYNYLMHLLDGESSEIPRKMFEVKEALLPLSQYLHAQRWSSNPVNDGLPMRLAIAKMLAPCSQETLGRVCSFLSTEYGLRCCWAIGMAQEALLECSVHSIRERVLDAMGFMLPQGGAGAITELPCRAIAATLIPLQDVTYADYLQSEEWKCIRSFKLAEAKNRCQLCNATGLLDVHHRTYESVRGMEALEDLTVLCRACHSRFHGKS